MDNVDKTGSDKTDTKEEVTSRFDPFFKNVTLVAGEQSGLLSEPTERIYATHSDLIFNVPAKVSLKETLFDFFERINVVEFKSVNDKFTYHEYVRGELRIDLRFLDSDDPDMRDYLNVFVLSRLPQRFLEQAKAEGIEFQPVPGRPWLYRAKDGLHHVVLVICRMLPLEPRYYPWLAFAPAASLTWRKYIRRMAEEGNQSYLNLAKDIYPEEMQEMMTDAEYNAKLQAAIAEAAKDAPPYRRDPILNAVVALEEVEQDSPEDVDVVLSLVLKPEQRLHGLKPQERLEGLKPQERLEGLKPQERLEGLKPQERLEGLKPQERLEGLKPDEVAEALTPEQKAALLKLLQQERQNDQK